MEVLIIHNYQIFKTWQITVTNVFPVPSIIDTGKKGKALHEQAVTTYESIINQAAEGGWELVNIDTVSSSQKTGCLAALFGGKDEVVTFKMLVFRKEK